MLRLQAWEENMSHLRMCFMLAILLLNICAVFNPFSFSQSYNKAFLKQETYLRVISIKSNTGNIKLADLCTPQDAISYYGIKVRKIFDAKRDKYIVYITKGRSVLARHTTEEGARAKDSSCFALYPLLGKNTKQLIVTQFSGGLHCCWSYWIYDLYPKFRLIFNGDQWSVGDGFDELEFQNLDADRALEFTQKILTFDYFDDLPYVSSPQPTIVFKYDPKLGKYYPANWRFVSFLFKGVAEEIKEIQKYNEDLRKSDVKIYADRFDLYRINALDVILRYIYVGREREAWAFYDRELKEKLINKARLKSMIKKKLKNDAVYKSIYGR
jgi:hypothetical protein